MQKWNGNATWNVSLFNVINWRGDKLSFGSSTVGRTYVETRSYTRDRTLLCAHICIYEIHKSVRTRILRNWYTYIYIRICFSIFKVYSGTVQRIVYYA